MPIPEEKELYISVDVETAGPNPSSYALLSIGACTVDERRRTFYVELKPGDLQSTSEAQGVHNLDMEALQDLGLPPDEAMVKFEQWVHEVTPPALTPVFVGFNAPFDWMFVADYFHRMLGRNPFGHSALDIKALFMGASSSAWSETTKRTLSPRYLDGRHLSHNALSDALDQAEIFEKILAEIKAVHAPGKR
jgi:DNA polymerase III epsilon subunit-like protein